MQKNVELFRKKSAHDFCGVDYFGKTDYFRGRKKKKTSVLMSKTFMVRLTESCDEHAVYCRPWLK